MKKKKLLLIVLAAIILVGVGVFAFRGFLFGGPKYTVVFDINTTPDDLTDDETWQVLTTRLGRGGEIPNEVELPYREGYAFAGWQTRPVVTREDLVNGVSPYWVPLGAQYLYGGSGTDTSMLALSGRDRTVTLYARWVEVKEIRTPEELAAIADDLYGAYILAADIDLNGVTWEPIGKYYSNYEMWNKDFWTFAFHGTLDGNGHSISGLTLTSWARDTESDRVSSVWREDGGSADGCVGLFGALAGATIRNLTLESPVIDLIGANRVDGDCAIYAAPLAAFDLGSLVENVAVLQPQVSVEVTDENGVSRTSVWAAASGLIGGGWSTTINNCSVQGGSIAVKGRGVASHGGDYYIGGMVGECYAFLDGCAADSFIEVTITDNSAADKDAMLSVYVGGLDASNTSCVNSTVDAQIELAVSKPIGEADISVGGLTGSQRYQMAESNEIRAEITSETDLDPEKGGLYVGKVLGSMNVPFITTVMLYSSEAEAGCRDNYAEVAWNGAPVERNMGAVPMLDGTPITYIAKGSHEIDGQTLPANIKEVTKLYGSAVPAVLLKSCIVWIINE